MKKTGITSTAYIFTIVLFMLAIWLPNIGSMFNIAPGESSEQRAMTKLPELRPDRKSIIEFQSKFMKYYVDNFGFRNVLIRWNSLYKLNVLRVDQFPKVLVGKKNWLYLIKDDEGNNSLDYYRSLSLFTGEKELSEWARPLVDIQKFLAARGIRMLVVFVPMKPRIYPEYVPDYLKPVHKETRLDQMMNYLKNSTSIDALDTGPALIAGKKEHLVFIKHDVHWNGFGAYYAYRAIMDRLSVYMKSMAPGSLDDYTIKTLRFTGGDLANMLGLKDMFSEDAYAFIRKSGSSVKSLPVNYPAPFSRFTQALESPDRTKPKAVVFHDSFFNFLKPFMAEHFSRMACFQSYGRFDRTVIDIEKPDIVIFEIAEHFLLKSPAYVVPMNM
jgi:alginate O-acetyltransferase complex protein AlgJ